MPCSHGATELAHQPVFLPAPCQVLAALPTLRRLYLRYDGLSGELPCELLTALPQLDVLSLSGEQRAARDGSVHA
jgi:hypothetical protein